MDEARPIRAAIVDDEPPARKNLRLLLRGEPGIEIAAECRNGAEAIAAIREKRPDVVFLDVQMPGISGFDVLEELGGEVSPIIIFVTAWDQHAVRAFEFNALDYLLKPFSDARFRQSMERVRDEIRRETLDDLGRRVATLLDERTLPSTHAADEPLRRFVIRAGGRVVFLRAGEVDWIEAVDYYARLHTAGKSHLIRQSMKELETKLDPARFLRVHRAAIVNLERIRELRRQQNGSWAVVLRDETEIAISRRRRERIEEVLTAR